MLWATRHNTVLTVVAAAIAPLLYLLFIDHYALNSFIDDDWSVVPMVHAALHDHLSVSLLWTQHNESRIVVGNLVDVLFAHIDQLDLRAIIFFDAVLFIASYVGLLVLYRRYTSTRLTPIPVLAIGIVWFSLADYQNALWAFQVSWYLTVFFFVMMLCSLLLPERRRALWLTGAVVLAVASSLSTVQGFVCWPIGAICILWPASSRRARPELAIWVVATIVTVGFYARGYAFSAGNTCVYRSQCTSSYELHHPQSVAAFFLALIGNVVPGSTSGVAPATLTDPARYVAVGLILFAVSVGILVHSWRHRASSEQLPLPGLLVLFALLFDVTIVVGRGGTGAVGAIAYNRYVMANLILLTGIVMWLVARVPTYRLAATSSRRRLVADLALAALAIFLVVQVTVATSFGVTNARSGSAPRVTFARLFVNMYPSCVISRYVPIFGVPETTLRDAAEDHLGEYGPTTYLHYREVGPSPADRRLAKALDEFLIRHTGTNPGNCFLPPVPRGSP